MKNDLPLVLGHYDHHRKIFGFFENLKNKNKAVIADSFPVYISGDSTSGKQEFIQKIISQLAERRQGLILFDIRGEGSQIRELLEDDLNYEFSSDLYIFEGVSCRPMIRHTFDPINPIIEDNRAFSWVVGDELMDILQPICLTLKAHGQKVSIETLKSFLNPTLVEQYIFEESCRKIVPFIVDYLGDLGFYTNPEAAAFRYYQKTHTLVKFIEEMEGIEYLFSTNPTVDMDDIYENNRVLVVNLPFLEKLNDAGRSLYGLVIYQILHKRYSQYNTPVIIDDISYLYDNSSVRELLEEEDNRKVILVSNDLNNKANHDLINRAQTIVILHQYFNDKPTVSLLKDKVGYVEDKKPFLFDQWDMTQLSPGQGFVVTRLTEEYDNRVYLNKHKDMNYLIPLTAMN